MRKRSGLKLCLLIIGIAAIVASLWFSGTLPRWCHEYQIARAGAWLPEVDQADVFLLGNLEEESKPGSAPLLRFMGVPIEAQTTINGTDAKVVAEKWREIPRGFEYIHLCHEPLYGLRFRRGDTIVLETTVCWNCETYDVSPSGSEEGRWEWGFDAHSTPAQVLLGMLMKKVPPSPEEQEDIHKEFPESGDAKAQ